MEDFSYQIVTLPSYHAVGLRWEGAYEEVPQLKGRIQEMSQRVSELDNIVNPDLQLGLSYHLRADGFVHYTGYEVEEIEAIPEGMTAIQVPELTYLITHHEKDQEIGRTYDKIFQWMKNSDFVPYEDPGKTFYDPLPIKHERYPRDRDFQNPHFDILIPLSKKSSNG